MKALYILRVTVCGINEVSLKISIFFTFVLGRKINIGSREHAVDRATVY